MSSGIRFALALGLIGLTSTTAEGAEEPAAPRISGPHTHENLSVFFIHGADTLEGEAPLTLEEALAKKQVVVHETQRVNELEIENLSDQRVFVQAGDIVKGGQQDRTFQADLMLEPRSGRVAIGAFCVEQGRWSRRGAESEKRFAAARTTLSSKELKLAARRSRSQRDVWSKVAEAQRKLSRVVGGEVRSELSGSSLPLALESPKLMERVDDYEQALSTRAAAHDDVIGYAFAINGKLNSAEVYGSHALFAKLWPKLLHASAVEAVSERGAAAAATPPSVEDVSAMLAEKRSSAARVVKTGDEMEYVSDESDAGYFFESNAAKRGRRWIHRSYIRK